MSYPTLDIYSITIASELCACLTNINTLYLYPILYTALIACSYVYSQRKGKL